VQPHARDRIVGATGLDRLLPDVFEARANCADAAVSLLGMPYAYWRRISVRRLRARAAAHPAPERLIDGATRRPAHGRAGGDDAGRRRASRAGAGPCAHAGRVVVERSAAQQLVAALPPRPLPTTRKRVREHRDADERVVRSRSIRVRPRRRCLAA
jgi:hypothetical protein